MMITFGCIREEDITLEQRMHQLTNQLMCPVCDAQTIDGSNAQISQDMRAKAVSYTHMTLPTILLV